MKRFLLAACAALLLSWATATTASADEPAIYVVDVTGDRLDAERVRASIARELSVTAVGPEDPRASTATARIQVEARGGQKMLRVTVQKAERPVSRVIELPDDATRAESAAVFLAGNLARDEAGDLLDGMKKPAAPQPSTPVPKGEEAYAAAKAAELKRDAEDLERMRTILSEGNVRGRKQRVYGAVGGFVVGAAMVVPGAYMAERNHSRESATFGTVLLTVGGVLTLFSAIRLIGRTQEEGLFVYFTEAERDSKEARAIIEKTDTEWRTRATNERKLRRFEGTFAIVIGSVFVASGALQIALTSPDDDRLLPALYFGLGAAQVFSGVYTLATEGPLERSYQSWQVNRRSSDWSPLGARAARPTFGFAPLPGGAAFSAGFAF